MYLCLLVHYWLPVFTFDHTRVTSHIYANKPDGFYYLELVSSKIRD